MPIIYIIIQINKKDRYYFYHNDESFGYVNICKKITKEFAKIAKALGLVWGGDWKPSKRDYPHFQLPGKKIPRKK